MYVTSAYDGLDEATLAKEPHAGKIFKVMGFDFFIFIFLNQTCQASQLLYLRVCIAYSVIYCKEELGVTPISYYNFVSFRNSSPLNLSFQLCQDI